MKKKRLVSTIFALMLASSFAGTAFAESYNIADGGITVTSKKEGQYVTQEGKVTDEKQTTETIITGTSDTNTVTIYADADTEAKVTLSDVNIDVRRKDIEVPDEKKAAVSTEGEGNATIDLDGTNVVMSGVNRAGVEKNNEGELTITDTDKDGGSLDATGGVGAAGIGGGGGSNGNNITIRDTVVSAKSAVAGTDIGAAGIGGGAKSWDSSIEQYVGGNGENITIENSVVYARGGCIGAGIGGGSGGDGSNISISNSTVTASGRSYAAGIGGGMSGNGENIAISDSNVTAKSDHLGAGIGGGSTGNGKNITVSGDTKLTVQGGGSYSGIGIGAAIGDGGGLNGKAGNEATPDTSTLTAEGWIKYYDADGNLVKIVTGTYDEHKEEPELAESTVAAEPISPEIEIDFSNPEEFSSPLYRVIDKYGNNISYKSSQKDGVLTITAEVSFATLTGKISALYTLMDKGIDTIVFVTNDAVSAYSLSNLIEKGTRIDSFALTHNGGKTFLTIAE